MGKVILVLFFGAGLCSIGFGVHEAWEQDRKIATYLPVEVTVVSSRVEQHRSRGRGGRKRTTYRPAVEYRYQVDGRHYGGNAIFPRPGGSGKAWSAGIVGRFPPGAVREGYHDPRAPAQAFLIRHHSFAPYLFILIPSGVLGAVGLGVALLRRLPPAEPVPWTGKWFEVPPALSLGRKIKTSLSVAVFWHAAGLLAAGHYFMAASSPYETQASIVTLTYEVLGLVPLSLVLYYSLLRGSVGNARVTIDRERPACGDEIGVRIEQEVYRQLDIEELQVALICDLTAQEKSGSKTVVRTTACHEDRRIALAGHPAHSGDAVTAELKFSIPAGGPPSSPRDAKGFPSFAWRITVRTRLPGSPDYRADFPITVLPAR